MKTFTVILLTLLSILLFFGSPALAAYGFASNSGAFGEVPPVLPGVPQMVLGIVGVILFLVSLGIAMYLWMEYPELRNYSSRNYGNTYNSRNYSNDYYNRNYNNDYYRRKW